MSQTPLERSGLSAESGQPLIGVLVEENGKEVAQYFVGDIPAGSPLSERAIPVALDLAGAWSDLDWEEVAEALNRIRHDSVPTPPIEL
jgi:hypothetical protein